MAALLGKASKLGQPALPSNEEFIRGIDYEELERRFQIHKYYPTFLHNYDFSTPQIRLMICDKPIYAKALAHIRNFRNPGTKKTFITEIDVETGEVTVHEKVEEKDKKRKEKREERKEKREERKEKREERKEKREEKREERREKREDSKHRKRHEIEIRLRDDLIGLVDDRFDKFSINSDTSRESVPYHLSAIRPPLKKPIFNNPFGEDLAPALSNESRKHSISRGRQNSVRTINEASPRNYLKERLRDMISSRRLLSALERTLSFDATQSNMAVSRGLKGNLWKLREKSRRQSEQIGTYTNLGGGTGGCNWVGSTALKVLHTSKLRGCPRAMSSTHTHVITLGSRVCPELFA